MMKLIIEISEDVYEECQGHIYFPDTGEELFNAVKNGTPLDDVKAEIENIDSYSPYRDGCWVMADVWKILDNIGSEVKPNEDSTI